MTVKISVSGLKVILGAGLAAGLAALLEPILRNAFFVFLLPGCAVPPDLERKRLGQGVDATDADSVQTAGNFVAVRVELAAGMQLGHHDLGSRDALFGVHIDGDAAAIVDDSDRVVNVNRDRDFRAMSRQRLINGVIDHLVDQMMQSERSGRADVHSRVQSDGLEPLEHSDAFRIVTGLCVYLIRCHSVVFKLVPIRPAWASRRSDSHTLRLAE